MDAFEADLRYNYAGLAAALISPKPITPDKALSMSGIAFTNEKRTRWEIGDIYEVKILLEQGLSWRQIGEVFGVTGNSVRRAVRRFQRKKGSVS